MDRITLPMAEVSDEKESGVMTEEELEMQKLDWEKRLGMIEGGEE